MRAFIVIVAALVAPTVGAQTLTWDTTLGQPGFDQGSVSALHAWDPDGPGPQPPQLLAGGSFTSSGGQPVAHLARWTGTSWVQLGPTLSGGSPSSTVDAITTWDPDGAGPADPLLIVGGRFATDGTSTLNNIAAWNGTQFLPLGSGIGQGGVAALLSWDPDGSGPANPLLVIGGQFATPTMRICTWNGSTFTALGGGLADNVFNLILWDPDGTGPANNQIIASGSMPLPSPGIVRFDGTSWQPMGPGFTAGFVGTVISYDPDGDGPSLPLVMAGGAMTASGPTSLSRLAYWTGTQWAPFAAFDNTVRTAAMYDPDGDGPAQPQLFLAGQFTSPVASFTRWNGTAFTTINAATVSGVALRSLVFDPDDAGPLPAQLVFAGTLSVIDGQPVGRIAALKPAGNCPGDLNGDNVVDGADLSVLLATFGNVCN